MLGTEESTPACAYLGRLSGTETDAWISQVIKLIVSETFVNPEIKNIVAVCIQELELDMDYLINVTLTLNKLGHKLDNHKVHLICNTPNARVFETLTRPEHFEVTEFPHRFGMFEVCASEMYSDSPQSVSWNSHNTDIVYMCGKNEHAHRVFPVISISESDYSDNFKYSFLRPSEPIAPDQSEQMTTMAQGFITAYNLPEFQSVPEFYNRYHSILDVPESAMVIDAKSKFIVNNPHTEQGRGYQHYTGRPIRDTDIYNSGALFVISETTQWPGSSSEIAQLHHNTGWYTEKTYRHINMGLPIIVTNRPHLWPYLVSQGFRDISKFLGPDYEKYNREICSNTELDQSWHRPDLSKLLVDSIDYFFNYKLTNPDEISEALEYNRRLLNSHTLWQSVDQTLGTGVALHLDRVNRYVNHTWYPDLQPEGEDHYLEGLHNITRD